MFAEVNEAFGVIDNTAVYSFQPFDDITDTKFRREFDTNASGLSLSTRDKMRNCVTGTLGN
jgi:hypothetical protein